MKINKALITAAGSDQRNLSFQILIDRNRVKKTVLDILLDEITLAGVKEIGVVVHPDDVAIYEQTFGNRNGSVVFIPQKNLNGYGHALLAAGSFLNNEPFLHLVGDHVYINREGESIAKQVIELAEEYGCSVSAVRITRENELMNFGTIGASRLHGSKRIFQVTQVKEKPTPTYAEQHLIVPGLRAGFYLCFFGIHVFTGQLIEMLKAGVTDGHDGKPGISDALNNLAKHSKYLALEMDNQRFDIGNDYGLLKAQLGITLSGNDRDYILSELLQFFIESNK